MQVINVIMRRAKDQVARGFLFRLGWNIISINPLVYNKCKYILLIGKKRRRRAWRDGKWKGRLGLDGNGAWGWEYIGVTECVELHCTMKEDI